MKQMSLIEMDGFLKGKCIPRDLKVNETNAEYLVRKFAEAEAKISALSEDHQKAIESIKQADAAVKLAHEKFSALAAENAGIKSAIPESRDIEDDNDNMDDVSLAEDFGFNHAIERMRRQIPETPTTDAFLAEVRAQGVDAAIEAAKNLVAQEYEYKDFKAAQSDCCMYPGSDLVGKVEMTEWLVDFAAQLRKGGNQ
ncbi:ead/Ea22-like family protein [Escherichia coli]|uniref:ead/Ea22-like family protein n=1 Tax=Escherichia coli TaxID=562 RepID=UPI000BE5D0E0|nr:ead/Ea22-like family protein [Escherichia coli]